MATGIDRILADVEEISSRLRRDDLTAKERTHLENERTRLRNEARDEASARRLWQISSEIVGLSDDAAFGRRAFTE